MTYIVRRGDTLWSIAQQFGVSPQAIMQANGITNPAMIFVGQSLIIPTHNQPFPPGPPSNIDNRVRRLEREVDRLQREVNQLDRRVLRLEQGRPRSAE